jgi:serine/threonine-protein kinase
MGEVYRAHDRVLRREVAIKVSRTRGDPKLLERFQREAHLAGRFDHPNIVRIFDIGQTEDGCPFLVMELLRGQPFTELSKSSGPMDPDAVADLLEGVASALDLIHAEGIVHRDLKLDNLMLVEQTDGSQRPKLLDFGVALASMEEGPRLTVDGAIVGTPLYAAPEILIGATPDASADVYSLAVVVYKLLTGSAPFEDLDSQALFRAKVTEAALAPSWLRPELAMLDDLLMSALSRDPAARPRTASDLIAQLRTASAPRPAPRKRWTRAHLYYAGGLLSFLAAGMILWLAIAR